MSTTTTAPPESSRVVRPHDRDFGTHAIYATDTPPATIAQDLTARERAILGRLLGAVQPDGPVVMTSRGDLRAAANTMQRLCHAGLVNGVGSRDARGSGNTPQTSWWWLTTLGERVAHAIAEGKAR